MKPYKCPKCNSDKLEKYGHIQLSKDYKCTNCDFIIKQK